MIQRTGIYYRKTLHAVNTNMLLQSSSSFPIWSFMWERGTSSASVEYSK